MLRNGKKSILMTHEANTYNRKITTNNMLIEKLL